MKHMKTVYKLFSCLALAGALTSCSKDFLETVPTSSYAEDFIFTTTDNVQAALNGLHKAMCAQYYSRQNFSGYPALQITMDCLGEDLVFPVVGNGWWTNSGEVRWNANRNAKGNVSMYTWRLCYRWISNANMIIDNIEGATGPQAQKDMLLGQALAYRAMSYFWLVQVYADRYDATKTNNQQAVPLVVDSKEVMKPLDTVENVYAQIVADLEQAIPLLTNKSNEYNKFTSKSDICGATVLGLRARVALTMQDWANAAKYAEQATTAGNFKLMTQEQYQEGFNDASNPEWMWAFEMIDSQTLYFYSPMAYMSWNFNSSNIRACPKCINSALYAKIPETDVRHDLFDPTGKAWKLPTSSYKGYPYMNRKFAVKDYSSSVADACYMRLGEMYLIAAEAYAKQGNNEKAQQLLFDLNKTRDASYAKSTKTGADLLDEIYTYRRIELWGEGFRFLDLKRLQLPLDRYGANHDPAVSLAMRIEVGDINWNFAIPQEEIDANDFIPANIND